MASWLVEKLVRRANLKSVQPTFSHKLKGYSSLIKDIDWVLSWIWEDLYLVWTCKHRSIIEVEELLHIKQGHSAATLSNKDLDEYVSRIIPLQNEEKVVLHLGIQEEIVEAFPHRESKPGQHLPRLVHNQYVLRIDES